MGEEKIQNTGRKSLKMKAEDIQDREPALRNKQERERLSGE